MARVFPLFSGSRGNAVWIEYGESAVLVDCGRGASAVEKTLRENSLSPEKLRAVFVTHEHGDHIAGLKAFMSSRDVPVFCSPETKAALAGRGILPEKRVTAFEGGVEAGGFYVTRFSTPHDCGGSSGYRITLPGGTAVGVCTDLGTVTDEIRAALSGCEAVMLESNHDVSLLYSGPYPAALKRRVAGETGHLSNGACAAELPALVESGATRIILAHLSRENNRPDIAAAAASAALLEHGMREGEDYILYVARESGGRPVSF